MKLIETHEFRLNGSSSVRIKIVFTLINKCEHMLLKENVNLIDFLTMHLK